MSGDASLPPNAPVANGVDRGHGEADASTTLSEVCSDMHNRVSAFLAASPKSDIVRQTQKQTRISLSVIGAALQDYEYALAHGCISTANQRAGENFTSQLLTRISTTHSFSSLSLSYNGGKDCLVLLILYLAALHTHFSSTGPLDRRKQLQQLQPFPPSIPAIYARPADPFPAVTAFVASSSRRYHLDLTTHVYSKTVSFRDAFAVYLAEKTHVKAIFVGTRRTDPHGEKLTFFDRTDGGWPDFVRVHPVIDWRLEEVWTFLRAEELGRIEYCSMYDEGYTSLGGVGDTVRNPKLRVVGEGDEIVRYRPAYELVTDGEERLGRE